MTRTFVTPRMLLAFMLIAAILPIILLAQPLPKVVEDGTKIEKNDAGVKIIITVNRLPDGSCKINGTFKWGQSFVFDAKSFGQGPCLAQNLRVLFGALVVKIVAQGGVPPNILRTIVQQVINQVDAEITALGG